jgi:hypothetical protein
VAAGEDRRTAISRRSLAHNSAWTRHRPKSAASGAVEVELALDLQASTTTPA